MNKQVMQKYFDVVVTALAVQGWKQAKNIFGNCVWLDHNGCRCAIGHLLPLETISRYQREGMSETIESALKNSLLPQDLWELDQAERNTQDEYDVHKRFAGKMQVIHDHGETPEEMRDGFQKFGRELELNWPLPT